MTEECEYCGGKFNNRQSLLNHQNTVQYCQKYRYILFKCELCGFTTKGIKNIDEHRKLCTKENTAEVIEVVSVDKLQNLLAVERVKSLVWRKLLEDNTNIKVSDIITEDKDVIQIQNLNSSNNMTILIEECLRNTDCKLVINKKEEDSNVTHKKNTYRSFVDEDINSELVNSTDLVDDVQVESDTINYLEVIDEFDALFEKLLQSRTYNKILDEIRIKRNSIIKYMHIDKYIELIQNHVEKMEKIFSIDKKYPAKRTQSMVSRGLYPLEIRLTQCGCYVDSHLEVDEIEKLFFVLKLSIENNKEFVPYSNDKLCGYFYNYGLALFPIEKLLDIFMLNLNGYHNVIYLPLNKSLDDDPYSFYILDKVNKDKKYWNMDCRLDDVSTGMVNNILPYMINMFRSIYKHIFGDNNFRIDYSSKCQITECDCEQLLQNIILLSNSKQFCKFLQQKVRKFATYKPRDTDKFNLKGDDPLQRKQFHEKDNDSVDVLKQLFDNISTEESVDFYRSRIT